MKKWGKHKIKDWKTKIILVSGVLLLLLSLGSSSADRAYSEIPVSAINSVYTLSAKNASASADAEGYMYVVWDDYDENNKRMSIFGSFSSDNGLTWSGSDGDEVISHNQYDARNPDIYAENRLSIHVVWTERNASLRYLEIKYAQYHYDGNWNLTLEKYITPFDGTAGDCDFPKISVDSNKNLHAVWQGVNKSSGQKEIYYGKSTDGGKTWTSEQSDREISDSSIPADASEPCVMVDGKDYIWVFYIKIDQSQAAIYYTMSQDYGDKWSYGVVTTYSPTVHINNLTAAFFNGMLFVFWEVYDPSEMRTTEIATSFFDYNSGWSLPILVSYKNDEYGAYNPSATANNNEIYVVWSQNDSKYIQLYVSHSADGTTWSGAQGNEVLTNTSYNHRGPYGICTPNNDLHVFWDMWIEHTKQRGSREVFTLSVPGGNIFELYDTT